MKAPQERSRSRREGAALVMILVLSLGALALVSVLISMSQNQSKNSTHRRTTKSLQEVVNGGLAMAMNEINRRRLEGSSYVDPTGHGYGALLFQIGASTQDWSTMGQPIRDADGRVIGRFRSDVYAHPVHSTRRILRVVACYPAFDTPKYTVAGADGTTVTIDPRQFAAAEMEIRRGSPPFDRNALSIRGDADVGPASGITGGSNKVDIRGIDGSNSVPAVNIDDTSTYNDFVSNINQFGTVIGASADGSTTASDAGTVTNESSGLLNATTVSDIAQGVNNRVTAVLAAPTDTLDSTEANSGSVLAQGTYVINSNMTISSSSTLKGKGTLVITADVTLDGTIDWDGDVIIARDGARLRNNGVLKVYDKTVGTPDPTTGIDPSGTGILCVLQYGNDDDVRLNVGAGDRIFVGDATNKYAGGFCIIGSNATNAGVAFDLKGKVDVYGIMTVMGNDLTIDFDPGAELNITGSLAFITPTGATDGLNVDFKNGMGAQLNFSGEGFDASLDALGQFYDPLGTLLPVATSSYWEPAAKQAFADQNTRFSMVDLASFTNIPLLGGPNYGY